MNLRFMKKKDGQKVLQQQVRTMAGYEFQDVPMVEEKTIFDTIIKIVEVYKINTRKYPDGLLVGKIDLAHLVEESNQRYFYPNKKEQLNIFGVPVMEHPKAIHGIFIMEEVK